MRFNFRKFGAVMLALACICALYGCGQEETPTQPTPAPTAAPTTAATTQAPTLPEYYVRYYVDGNVYAALIVTEGEIPPVVEPQVPGMRFVAWLDEAGQTVDPYAAGVTGDTAYYALLYPNLTAQGPYLLADEQGCLRPDDLLTGGALADALNALAVDGAQIHFPELPAEEETVTKATLTALLDQLFPTEEVAQAAVAVEAEELTRRDFAVLMNSLLRRGAETGVVIAEGTFIPYDLSTNDPGFDALMEAGVVHTHGGEDSWFDALVNMPHDPGFFNMGGWLYYADENGQVVRDTQVGKLTFGADGRYTCGDAELDEIVAGILDGILVNNPGQERIDLLRRAFEYSRDSFTYLRRYGYGFGETGWEINDAKTMFTTLRGNCYNFAASFWALARGLGYEAIAISGTMTGTDQPHGWVEIYFDGTPYIFDTEMEYVYIYERGLVDNHFDMFMVSYSAGTYWNYKRYNG